MNNLLSASRLRSLCAVLTALLTILACILPMGQLPVWNGELPGHRNQYELMAENLLAGRLDFAYGDEDAVLALENPYDPAERKETKVRYHWDHAYYNGQYYMYFGIVPVLLVFLPYRVITGTALTTFHATQLFAAITVAGIFALFWLLYRRFFKNLPYGIYLLMSVAVSVMSVWYASSEPALYCTAITAALALEVWSLYFFIRAVWVEQKENRQLLLAAIGAALGALTFGCRPTVALANLLVIPMLVVFIRQRKWSWKLLGKLVLAALPYAIVAAGLMLYNYARFDDPFEFGQKYQLTVADQSNYSIALNGQTVLRIINETLSNFFAPGKISATYPYLRESSVFFNFPVLLLWVGLCKGSVRRELGRHSLLMLVVGLAVTVLVITAMDILWTPYLLERYRMDIYYLLGIGCFLAVGFWFEGCNRKHRLLLSGAVGALCVAAVVTAHLLYTYRVGLYL